ncbi:MAG: multidrug efflux SMR transporter [Methanosarcinales archaeon]|uniref:Small multidrug resistance pump n=1 Tax=Candidatus Argoarchaeum ethanivorans TaxID=2608793 RepID=A0A8B3RZP4_9EURY|nr:MAG: small multidrug resistance pump [Candidatus Argoarchaeum ethanivorans]RZN13490.1 MAG: multidrug efflux SMR transporter [Methanosarcinales archaeon]
MKWILLFIGIIAELCGSTCMKMSEGFTKLYPSIFTFVFWAIGLTVFIFALKKFELSFAYAIWAGLGIVGVSIIGMVFFKEPHNILKIISILIIVVGVILLNISDILLNK